MSEIFNPELHDSIGDCRLVCLAPSDDSELCWWQLGHYRDCLF